MSKTPLLIVLSRAVTLAGLSLVFAATATAQSKPAPVAAATPSQPTPGAAAGSVDKSGTNPALFLRSAGVRDDYQSGDNGFGFNVFTANYAFPVAKILGGLNVKAPINTLTAGRSTNTGIGDVNVNSTSILHVDAKKAWVLNGKLALPTGAANVGGTGKWVASPGVTFAWFATPKIIIAPAYVHNFSFAGDGDRADVHRGDFDLYAVYTPLSKAWWLTADLTVSPIFNAANGTPAPATFRLQHGRTLGKAFGGALNGFVRPGFGLGDDKPYNWNVEFGVNVVGF